MAPKKAPAAKSPSLPKGSEETVSDDSKTGAPQESRKPAAVRRAASHPSTMDMVKEAVKELDSRKGVSAQAVRSFIRRKYATVGESRVNAMVRKALVKGLESGAFVRPAASSTITGAQGRFRLAAKQPKETKPIKKANEAKENANPNVGKAKEPKSNEMGAEKAKPVKKVKSAVQKPEPGGGSKVAPAKKPKAKQQAGSGAVGEGKLRPEALEASGGEHGDSGKAVLKKVNRGVVEMKAGQSEGVGVTTLKRGARKAPAGKKAPPKAGAVGAAELVAEPPKASARRGKKAS
ncbi:sperm-specific protein PHI-2B/PHI-3 [Electrophorus electricus]|uniref:sperm-specific protein PHI-2B/PHI-3 n=1 Tax=Electrophorus electricus TaxID=8005 RepID=UPI0015D0551F|nr:sperm-specific protein PHI-2B/PHI-3 [Electrophorus electricus]